MLIRIVILITSCFVLFLYHYYLSISYRNFYHFFFLLLLFCFIILYYSFHYICISVLFILLFRSNFTEKMRFDGQRIGRINRSNFRIVNSANAGRGVKSNRIKREQSSTERVGFPLLIIMINRGIASFDSICSRGLFDRYNN